MIDISIIIPVHNGEKWIDNCMKSIESQTLLNEKVKLEIIVFNDGSNDNTLKLLDIWSDYFNIRGLNFIITGSAISKGVGAAKNGAIKRSSGRFLCFQDIDDVMHQDRIALQWKYAVLNHNALIGSRLFRQPADSTPRFIQWANNLSPEQLMLQIYTSNGPTLLMPTWFCHKSVYEHVGGFDESGAGTPEDLIFFHKHIDLGGQLHRIDEELLIYTYHEGAATFSISRDRIWRIQFERLQQLVISKWNSFTIWNAGKAGRRLVRSLLPENLKKVRAFCDVDNKKIERCIELYCPYRRTVLKKIPVIHFSESKPPIIICVKLNLTNGQFENNLRSMNLSEGVDYVLFN